MSREAIQLQTTMAEAMKKTKILEETNKVMSSEKNKVVTQLREMEERNNFQMKKISELEEKIEIAEKGKFQENEKNRNLRKIFSEMTERNQREVTSPEKKDETIKKLMSELSELREKSSAESGSLRTRIFSQIGKTETLLSEKSNLEKTVQDLTQDHTSLTTHVSDLHKQVFHLVSEKDLLLEQLTTTEKKNRFFDLRINPLEKKLREKESELLQMENRRTQRFEEMALRIAKLEQDFRRLSEERENLLNKQNGAEKNVKEKIFQIRKEDTETVRKFQNQIGTTEKLTVQKWNATLRLGEEIKRNGILVKENSELRRTLLAMQQVVAEVVMDHGPPLPRIVSQPTDESETAESGLEQPEFAEFAEFAENQSSVDLGDVVDPQSGRVGGHGVLVQNETQRVEPVQNMDWGESGEVVMIRTGGLLASLPIVGRFWGWKTFHKKHEIIV